MLVAVMAGLSLLTAPAASAHPLGNFTVNYYTGIRAEPSAVVLDLVVDRAEIPTLQALPDAKIGQQPAGAEDWKARECAALAAQAVLTVGGRPQTLSVTFTRLEVLPGAAGLATSRLECTAGTPANLDTVGSTVTYEAAPTGGRVGWHEVTARGEGVTLVDSTVPADSPSKQLTAYPQDLLSSPLSQRTATFTVRAGSGQTAEAKPAGPMSSSPIYGLDRLTTVYTGLVSRTSLTPGYALLALLLSIVLGAMHAFAPGHGKTLMAAYLVGREGTWRQAAVIGISVTVTHTIGVLLLGIALSAAAIAAPEQVYPWLGLISGVLLTVVGLTLLRSARGGHNHGPGGHTHGPAPHSHGPEGHIHERSAPQTARQTLTARKPRPSLLTVAAAAPRTERDRDHDHDHGHDGPVHDHGHDGPVHDHGGPVHDHGHDQGQGNGHNHAPDHDHSHDVVESSRRRRRGMLSTGRLAVVGLVGGMVPSPSALLVLLGGIALGRAWFGAILVFAYGAGMAAALVGTGLFLVAARDRLERWNGQRTGRALPGQAVVLRWTRRLPVLTAMTVIVAGLWIAVSSVAGR
jgi:nickel/cobalt exporter